jgi:outer membrane protein OmpA-like peptidoglycan-associated protein
MRDSKLRWLLVVGLAACDVSASAAPAPAPPPDAGRGKVVITDSDPCGLIIDAIYFDANSAALAARETPVIDGIATMLRCLESTHEAGRWQILGSTAPGERDRDHLRRARAQTVLDALIARHVNPAVVELGDSSAHTRPGDSRGPAWLRRVDFWRVP